MPRRYDTKYLHICTTCGKERYTSERLNPSGLCNVCFPAQINAHTLHFVSGALYAEETLARFWGKVDKEAPCACHPWEERCWIWIGRLTKEGYGVFGLATSRNIPAHRFAYQALHGALPLNLLALHRPPCLLRHCVRHIYAGTHQQNTNDIKVMQRLPMGEQHYRTTLTEASVRAIRADYAEGVRICALVAKYGRTKTHIWEIVHRKSWKHLP